MDWWFRQALHSVRIASKCLPRRRIEAEINFGWQTQGSPGTIIRDLSDSVGTLQPVFWWNYSSSYDRLSRKGTPAHENTWWIKNDDCCIPNPVPVFCVFRNAKTSWVRGGQALAGERDQGTLKEKSRSWGKGKYDVTQRIELTSKKESLEKKINERQLIEKDKR